MSSTEMPVAKKKLPLMKLALIGGVLALIGAVVVYFVGWKTAWDQAMAIKTAVMDRVSAAGPLVYFTAMAILPAVGIPNLAFALTAGPLFGAQLGLGVVTVYSLLALTINLTLAYWLARRWGRPLITKLLRRFGYELPEVPAGDMTEFIVLLRVTPGVPFLVQNYLPGLAKAPFLRYLVISCIAVWAQNIGFIFFGDALNQGKGKLAMYAVMLILVLAVGLQLVRKHYAKKKAAANQAVA